MMNEALDELWLLLVFFLLQWLPNPHPHHPPPHLPTPPCEYGGRATPAIRRLRSLKSLALCAEKKRKSIKTSPWG